MKAVAVVCCLVMRSDAPNCALLSNALSPVQNHPSLDRPDFATLTQSSDLLQRVVTFTHILIWQCAKAKDGVAKKVSRTCAAATKLVH